MKKFYTLAILALTLLACNRESGREPLFPHTDHFIDGYHFVNQLYAGTPYVAEQDGFGSGDLFFSISLGWNAEILRDELNDLREQLGDVSRIRYGIIEISPRTATINPFIKLTIVSDSDYNDIPAGSPLDAIVRVYGSTAYPVLKDLHCQADYYDQELKGTWEGYDKSSFVSMSNMCKRFQKSYYWYDKMVSELQPDDLFLLDRIMYFRIAEKPAIKNINLR